MQFQRVRITTWHLPCKHIRSGEMLQCRKACIKRGNRVLQGADSQKENVKGGFESSQVVKKKKKKIAGKVYLGEWWHWESERDSVAPAVHPHEAVSAEFQNVFGCLFTGASECGPFLGPNACPTVCAAVWKTKRSVCVCACARWGRFTGACNREPVLVAKNDDYLPVFSPSPAVSDVLQQQKDRVSNPWKRAQVKTKEEKMEKRKHLLLTHIATLLRPKPQLLPELTGMHNLGLMLCANDQPSSVPQESGTFNHQQTCGWLRMKEKEII